MFGINDVVMYGSNGICKISAIEKRNFKGKEIEYFILNPIYNDNNTFYVPANNENALKSIRPVCSKEEADNLILHIRDNKIEWIENETVRKEEYKKIIKSGNREEIIKLINTLYLHRKELSENNKKFRSTDENLLNIAEGMIFEEFAYVLGIGREEVGNYIKNHTA